MTRLSNSRAASFAESLGTLRFDCVFNPYFDCCDEHDHPGSAQIRRHNLTVVLGAASEMGIDSMWLGRDLGYRGGRRTGLALTDEAHLWLIRSTFRNAPVQQATITGPVKERTAHEIWKMVRQLPSPPFLWNVFPFHPHEPERPMTNRPHSKREAELCEDILDTLLNWLKPRRLVALGQDAHKALVRFGRDAVCVRHPSYGGQADFIAGIRKIYRLSRTAGQSC